jgi:hypothetical protein
MPLEDDKLEALRSWGRGLRDAGAEEQAAAGRAILMLIEEVERLQLELLRTRELATRAEESLGATLRERLAHATGGGDASASPEAWIESLRRQE